MYAPFPFSAEIQISKADNGWIVRFQDKEHQTGAKTLEDDLNTPSMSDFAEDCEDEWDFPDYGRGCFPSGGYKTYVFTDKNTLMKFLSEQVD